VTGPTGVDPLGTTTSTTSTTHAATGASDGRSLGEIVGDISNDLTTLVKQELELARTELKAEATKAGKGAGMLGGAGVAGLLVAILASFALAYLLDNWMPVELAFLITALLWGIVAAVLASRGRKELKNANPQLPKTQQTLKEDAAWARAQKN
jgi:F0F1-type ATP synthase assembly protein I